MDQIAASHQESEAGLQLYPEVLEDAEVWHQGVMWDSGEVSHHARTISCLVSKSRLQGECCCSYKVAIKTEQKKIMSQSKWFFHLASLVEQWWRISSKTCCWFMFYCSGPCIVRFSGEGIYFCSAREGSARKKSHLLASRSFWFIQIYRQWPDESSCYDIRDPSQWWGEPSQRIHLRLWWEGCQLESHFHLDPFRGIKGFCLLWESSANEAQRHSLSPSSMDHEFDLSICKESPEWEDS